MLRSSVYVLIATTLLMVGWIAGKAQTLSPTFELVVNAPAGETTVECVKGCELAWVERGVNPNAIPKPSFTFKCSGAAVTRCSSARVGGWIR